MKPSSHRAARVALLAIAALFLLAALPAPRAAFPAAATPAAATPVFLPAVFLPGDAAPLTAQQLIARARAAGQISYGTSLLYRAYALFGDPRLPRELLGAGSEGEDGALFVEIAEAALSDAERAQLRPFVVRPDHPESVFSASAAAVAAPGLAAAACDARGWAAVTSAVAPVKVHALCAGKGYDAALAKALAAVEELWGPMVALMGPPILDEGGDDAGGSTEIDIYLLPSAEAVVRRGADYTMGGLDMGQARVTAPFRDGTASSFVMIGDKLLASGRFKSALAHELFHVFQSTHNSVISFRGRAEWWFTEASAVWAESHFVRAGSADQVHARFVNSFQRDDLSLHTSADPSDPDQARERLHMYAAYIWPFFMEQERGARAVADAWRAMRGVGNDWEKGMAAIDAQLPFAANFRRFAVRNLNAALLPGDPVQPRYVALDPSFPDGARPSTEDYAFVSGGSSSEPAHTFRTELPALRARYFQVTVLEGARGLTVALRDTDRSAVDLDLLLKRRGGGWEHLAVDGAGRASACDVEEAYLIVSNHSLSLAKPATVDIFAPTECREQLAGSVQYRESGSTADGGDTLQLTVNVSVRMRYDPAEEAYVDDGSSYTLSGTRRIVVRGADGRVVQESDITYRGAGGFPEHAIAVDHRPGDATLFFDATPLADVTTVTTLYADGTSYTFTSTEEGQPLYYGCGEGASRGVLGTGAAGGASFTIDCTNSLDNERQTYRLTVTGRLAITR